LSALPLSVLLSAQDRPCYGTGTWDAAVYGNHRAVIRVAEEADAVYVRIPWRRRDRNPDQKGLVIVDAATQKPIRSWVSLEINREYGEIAFQPVSGAGDYYVYYLVNRMEGRSNYPTVTYPGPEEQADPGWRDRHRLGTDVSSEAIRSRLPAASVHEIQSIDAFNSFSPMEVIATSGEKEALLERHGNADFLLFPEDRRYPVRMTADLPLRWIETGAEGLHQGQAARGEYYVFQVAVYAFRIDLPDLEVSLRHGRHGLEGRFVHQEGPGPQGDGTIPLVRCADPPRCRARRVQRHCNRRLRGSAVPGGEG